MNRPEIINSPASSRDARAANRKALEDMGIDLFPAAGWNPDCRIADLAHMFEEQGSIEVGQRPELRIAGRLFGKRDVGAIFFADLWQEHASVQLRIRRDDVSAELWSLLAHLDIGDFLGAVGRLVRTRRGELTLDTSALQVLGKPATTPAIGKLGADGRHHGAQMDRGSLLRERRHVAMMTDATLFRNIEAYGKVLEVFREVMREEGYLEVQTSVMGRYYGGAAATPFTTYSRAMDEDLFLRVSPEPDLKRMLAGGFERVYEIGRNWRNEGIDATHQPSFTSFEAYRAWSDYEVMMELTEKLVCRSVEALHGRARLVLGDTELDFTPPWPRLPMNTLVAQEMGVLESELTEDLMRRFWQSGQPGSPTPENEGQLLVKIFETYVEDTLTGPCFVVDYPLEGSPLTKRHRDKPDTVERFEAYMLGIELANAYSELNDPNEQRIRLEKQDDGRDEAYGVDEYFLAAVEDGMPQAGGLGIGMDRLVSIITGTNRLSDVIPFPLTPK